MTAPRRRQAGYAIAAISLIGLAAMSAAAMMISDDGASDAAQLEEGLVKLRAEWAAVGHMTYTISRARQQGLCNGNCGSDDSSRAGRLQGFAEELYNANGSGITNGGGTNRFKLEYTELSATYSIDTDVQVSDRDTPTDGRLDIAIRILGSANVPTVKKTLQQMNGFGATLCVGLAAAGDPCPAALTKSDTGGIARLAEFRVDR